VFDCIGHSHSLFHILVVLSIGCYHRAVLQAFVHRDKL
jgi:predicted membrane channel-forming protein YqfA (hemolysin III family)